jgi:6-pyruvoyltetrahydropterin/6-carboxytetrahydropterin synthase
MEIFKEFTLEAAHFLPYLPEGHKCRRLHGHSFRIEVHVCGEVQRPIGWVMDFAEINSKFQPLFEQLDHYCLNQVPGLENPTSENLARWIWQRLKPELPGLSKIIVRETCSAGCVYEGNT